MAFLIQALFFILILQEKIKELIWPYKIFPIVCAGKAETTRAQFMF